MNLPGKPLAKMNEDEVLGYMVLSGDDNKPPYAVAAGEYLVVHRDELKNYIMERERKAFNIAREESGALDFLPNNFAPKYDTYELWKESGDYK